MTSELRVWHGADGKYTVEATFAGIFQKNKVKLLKANGGTVALPLERLCQEDRDYVKQMSSQSAPSSTTNAQSSPVSRPPPQPHTERPSVPPVLRDKSTILAYARMDNKGSTGLASFLRETASSKSPAPLGSSNSSPPSSLDLTHSDASLIAAVDQLAVASPSSSTSLSTAGKEKRSYAPLPNPAYAPKPNPLYKKLGAVAQRLTLLTLPPFVLAQICQQLDVRSILHLSTRVNKSLAAVLNNPQTKAYGYITFAREYHYLVDHPFVLALANHLKRKNLIQNVHTIVFDSTKVQELTIMYAFEYFVGLRHLSIKSCWDTHSYPLANLLARRNASKGADRLRLPHLRSVEFGKILRRGEVPGGYLVVKSESYGQDIGLIGLALRGLAGHDIKFDTYLCGTCDRGAAKPTFDCSFCGPVQLVKCWSCAPKCERCQTRACGLSSCNRIFRLNTKSPCGRCREPFPVCNQPSCPANRAGPICKTLIFVLGVDWFHVQETTLSSVWEDVEHSGVYLVAVLTKVVWTSAPVDRTEEYADDAVPHAKSVVAMNFVQCAYDDMPQSVIR
ncbi:hypothetical protein INT43_002440 [Umbelopsis isabellina]|uniref:F-box domain-containing protein n=1 Tax=Mortierella isabellina TaxID=91625 RepID=A0A8H7Q4W6_MORIS|nr:hypothetical protein INT43_002440 [Umbelopsis isabellina]